MPSVLRLPDTTEAEPAVPVGNPSLARLATAEADARGELAAGRGMVAAAVVDEALAALRGVVRAGGASSDESETLAMRLCVLRAEAIQVLGGEKPGAHAAFLRRTAPAAMLGDWEWGVPASITLAQAIIESGWGRSAPGHNLFGVRGIGPAGATRAAINEVVGGLTEVRAGPLKAYHSEAEALADHARLLGQAPAYARARGTGDDFSAFARALQGVYASAPDYAQALESVIGSERLDRFDWTAADERGAAGR